MSKQTNKCIAAYKEVMGFCAELEFSSTTGVIEYRADVCKVLKATPNSDHVRTGLCFIRRGLWPIKLYFSGLIWKSDTGLTIHSNRLNAVKSNNATPPQLAVAPVTEEFMVCHSGHNHYDEFQITGEEKSEVIESREYVCTPGEIYILLDPSCGDYKMGGGKDADDRLEDANGTMRSPSLPKVLLVFRQSVLDWPTAEDDLHERFSHLRISPDREWFKADQSIDDFIFQNESEESEEKEEEEEQESEQQESEQQEEANDESEDTETD